MAPGGGRDHVQCGQHLYQGGGDGGVAGGIEFSVAEGWGRGVGDVAVKKVKLN